MSYHVVIDLEMCKVPWSKRTETFNLQNETIQIGAVLLDDEYEIVGQFNSYVSPEYGFVDRYINNFTGISQKNVSKSPTMEEALKLFTEWVPAGEVEIVAWSANDERQIRREMEGKHIENPRMEELFENWTDCQKTFAEKLDTTRCFKLSEALVAADIAYEGRAHDGLSDAYNTALLFAKMETEENFAITEIYESTQNTEIEHLSSSLGDLFSSLNLQIAS